MRLKKFIAGFMALLMCLGVGHFTYAENEVQIRICLPSDVEGVRMTYAACGLQYDADSKPYAMLTPGETYLIRCITEAGYETYWYMCDSYAADPDEQYFIHRGQDYNYVPQASDDGKYLIAVVKTFDEAFTLTIDTCGHGENIVVENVQGGSEVTTVIKQLITDGRIPYRDGDKIVESFFLDARYTLNPDVAMPDEYRVNRNMTVYEKWDDEIKKVDITITNPTIGKTCVLDTQRFPGSYSNGPVVTDNIGGQYTLSNASGGAFWFKDFDLSTVELTESYAMDIFQGEITADLDMYANINLFAASGYMFTESTEIFVNGVRVEARSFMQNSGGWGMGFGFGSFWMNNKNFSCERSISFVVPVTPEIVPDYCEVTAKMVKADPVLDNWTWFGQLDMNYSEYTGNDIKVSGDGKRIQGEKTSLTVTSDGSKAFIMEISSMDSKNESVNIPDLPYELRFEKGETSKTIEYTVPSVENVTINFNIMDSLIMKIVNTDSNVLSAPEFIIAKVGEPVELILECADGYRLSDTAQFKGSEGVGNPAWEGSFFNPTNYCFVNPEVVDTRVKNRLAWTAGAAILEVHPNVVFVGYQSVDEQKMDEVIAVDPQDNYRAPGLAFNNESEKSKEYVVELGTPNALTGFTQLKGIAFDGLRLMSGVETTSGTNGIGDVTLYITIGKVGEDTPISKETRDVTNLSSLKITVDPGEYVTYSILEKETSSQLDQYSYEIKDVTEEEAVTVEKGFVFSDDEVKHLVVSDKIGITSVKINKSMAEIAAGESEQLLAVINPEDTTEAKTLVWSSSNPDVATVDSTGKVSALKAGTAFIKATAVNGVAGECLVTVKDYEMEDNAKFVVQVSSVSQQLGSLGYVRGTVYNDYHGELIVHGVQVNDGNVTIDLWMQNVGSLGVDSLRHYNTSINRENGVEHALETLTVNIFDLLVGKSITGIVGDDKVVYTISMAEGDEYKLLANTNEDDARKVWHALINENTVRSYTGEDDSKITIARGSWFNLGDEKLVFEDDYKEDLVLDNFNDLSALKKNMKDALKIAEGDGSVTVYLEKGSIISVGQSKLELLDDLRITFSLDGSVYEKVFTEASEAADNELLGKIFAITVSAVDSLEDNTDVTFEFGHIVTGEVDYTWAEDYSEVTATASCDNNPEHVVTETVKTTSKVTKPATCTDKGETTYTAEFENEVFETQTKVVKNIDRTGHKPAEAVKENNVEPTCTQAGGYDMVVYCSVCHEKLSSEHVTVEAKGHVPGEPKHENEVAATCTKGGSYDEVVRCTVCNEIISSTPKTTEALGHQWGEWKQTKAPTCSEKGEETRECSRCHEKETRELDMIDHQWDEGTIIVDPTFSNTGLIEYKCLVCGEKRQEELPKGKVVRINAGSETNFTIAVGGNYPMIFESENSQIANAGLLSVGTMTNDSGVRYTRKIRVLGDSVGFTKIAMKVNGSTLAYIYAIVSAGSEDFSGCVGDVRALTLITFNNQNFKVSDPDVKLSVSKELKINKVTIGEETLEAPAYYNTLVLTFEKPVTGKVTITTEKGDIYCINAKVADHDWGEWKYDGASAKTHTHVCSADPSHKETQNCEFDEGVVNGNTITYTCKICKGTYTQNIETPDVNGVIRVAGDNRFGTSQKIAAAYMRNNKIDKVDAVILANGDVFADALAGSYLSAVKNAPIIITRKGKEAEVNAYINSILKEGGAIYVLGGTAAVPEGCLNGLTGKGYSISRLWGNNRYLTNLDILDSVGIQGNRILVATGNNFADSLSASATGLPILLVRDDGLTNEQKEFLSRNSGKEFIILGDTNAVGGNIESELKSYGTVRRIRGANRAKTSIEIAIEFFPEAEMAVVAYSHEFPDGLCGGPLAHQLGAPLLLTRDQNGDDTAAYLNFKRINVGYVLGGPVRLTDALVRKVFGLDSTAKIVEFK